MAPEAADRYADMTVAELRRRAREAGIGGVWEMRKDELVQALSRGGGRAARRTGDGSPGRAQGPGGSRSGSRAPSRSGSGTRAARSRSTRSAKEISSPGEHADRPGQTLVTGNPEVIRRWAEERDATPATVRGTRHGGRPGVLRFDFPGYGGRDLEHIPWDEWLGVFEERNLSFIFQERKADGAQSNFFRLESPDREDA